MSSSGHNIFFILKLLEFLYILNGNLNVHAGSHTAPCLYFLGLIAYLLNINNILIKYNNKNNRK